MRSLLLWFQSREFGNILSGLEYPTDQKLKYIKEKSGYNLTKDDINKFSKLLSTFEVYNKPIYRGISREDDLYKQIQSGNVYIKTKRYYSCSKNINIAKKFGQNILLIIDCKKKFQCF